MIKLSNIAPNQNVVTTPTGLRVFYSYETPVIITNGKTTFVTKEKFSKTTSKHIAAYLRALGTAANTVAVDADIFATMLSVTV